MGVQTPDIVAGTGDHVVQFYERDSDLARCVSAYLAGAVRAGHASIVIATAAHRAAFAAELAVAGVDVSRLDGDGTIVWLDAADTLSRFMTKDRIDPEAFRSTVGGIVREVGRDGREIRAYGEMVALLWDAGDVVNAIELEKLWNELARDLRFALWCAYHAHSLAVHEHAAELHEVCHLHTSVIDAATARFPAGADAPLAARRFVSSVLERQPYEGRVATADAKLVISELATNAVLHAGTPFSVTVRPNGSTVRISVRDWSAAQPLMRNGSLTALSGRGLHLVAALADDWGCETDRDGKSVWADLPLG